MYLFLFSLPVSSPSHAFSLFESIDRSIDVYFFGFPRGEIGLELRATRENFTRESFFAIELKSARSRFLLLLLFFLSFFSTRRRLIRFATSRISSLASIIPLVSLSFLPVRISTHFHFIVSAFSFQL